MRIPSSVGRGAGTLLVCSACLYAQGPLQITYPLPGTILAPGETTQVNVLASAPMKGVGVIGTDPLPFFLSPGLLPAPPYQFELTIPAKIRPRRYQLTATGISASGQNVDSGGVVIDVERRDPPKKLVTRSVGYELSLVDTYSHVPVEGIYNDGTQEDLVESSFTTFTSQDPRIVTVSRYGQLTPVSPGATTVVVRHLDLQSVVSVTVLQPISIKPAQQTMFASQTRTFIARVTDPAHSNVTYQVYPSLGSIDQDGQYTAPDAIDAAQTVSIIATSVSYPNLRAVATVTLDPKPSVEVSPTYAVLYPGQTQRFSATRANAGGAVKWSAIPEGAGTIDATGVFTASTLIPKLTTVLVRATSVTKPSVFGEVKIYASPQPFTLFLPQSNLTLSPGAEKQITVLELATDRFWHPVALSIQGPPAGVIVQFGAPALKGSSQTILKLSADANTVPGTYTIVVTGKDTVYTPMVSSKEITLVIADR